MATGRDARGLEESQCHLCLHEGEPRELQNNQPHLSPLEGEGAADPRYHFQAYESK